MIDPRRKNRLHCVLEAVVTSSEPSETTWTGSFWGDRAKDEENLAGATIDPPSNNRLCCVFSSFFHRTCARILQNIRDHVSWRHD